MVQDAWKKDMKNILVASDFGFTSTDFKDMAGCEGLLINKTIATSLRKFFVKKGYVELNYGKSNYSVCPESLENCFTKGIHFEPYPQDTTLTYMWWFDLDGEEGAVYRGDIDAGY